jgi:hypothetical protein
MLGLNILEVILNKATGFLQKKQKQKRKKAFFSVSYRNESLFLKSI